MDFSRPSSEVNQGNTYRLSTTGSPLFVVVTDPDVDDIVVLAALSANPSRTAGDAVLEPGDHPYINQMTGVVPDRTRICPASDILQGVEQRMFLPLSPVSDGVVAAIRGALLASNRTKPDLRDYLAKI